MESNKVNDVVRQLTDNVLNVSPSITDLQRKQAFLKSSRLLDHESFIQQFKSREQTDAELIEDYNIHHNQQAFDELYKRHKSKMLTYLYGILHIWEDAKDVLHDGWEAVLRSFNNHSYTEEQDFACWFKSICYHKAIEWQREKHRFFYGSDHLPNHADSSFNAEQRLENSQREMLLRSALNLLSDKERQVVILRAIEDRNFYQISVVMNIKVNVARAVYSRAVKVLKRMAG